MADVFTSTLREALRSEGLGPRALTRGDTFLALVSISTTERGRAGATQKRPSDAGGAARSG